jgi:aldehyde dehydrogenase (NAD+)
MDISKINDIINSQKDFLNKNSNTISSRILLLKKLLLNIKIFEDEIYEALSKDLRKAKFESFITEILLVEKEIKLFIKNLSKWSKDKKVKESILNFPSKNYLKPEPYGKVLIITPWNYPFQLSLTPLIGAFSSGNTVVIKPSELAPNTSSVLNRLIRETFPENIVSVIQGDAEVSKSLLSKKWDYIFFTGSTRVGKIVASEAAKNLTPITLELGGKSPCIIDKGVNIKKAAKRIVSGKFINCGQTCIAPDYILVNDEIKSKLIDRLKIEIVKIYGNKPNQSNDYGRIISKNHVDRLIKIINGQNIIFGGHSNKEDKYIEPTLIIDPDINSPIMSEEIFGPILPIISYNDVREIEKVILKNPNPLAFYVFSNNKKFINYLINNFSFGGCVINDTLIHYINSNLPFGGIGNSGMGAYRGKYSFDTFSHYKPILKKQSMLDIPFRFGPYPKSFNTLKKLLSKF